MKYKSILSLVFIIYFYSQFKSQNFDWAKQIGGIGSEYATSVKMDVSGNIYTLGRFDGVVDFDPGPLNYTLSCSGGSADIFLTKFDSVGNFVWVKIIGGINDEVGNSVFLDAGGNIFITGVYQTGTDFNPGPGTYTLSAGSGQNAFVLKLDNSGNFVWVSSFGNSLSTIGYGVSVDLSGNIFVTGSFNGTNSDFDPGPSTFTLSTSGSTDVFIAKLNSLGGLIWVEKVGGSGIESPYSLFVDASSNVLITGYFRSTSLDLDPSLTTYTVSNFGQDDVFILKLGTNGNFQWGKQIGGFSYDLGMSVESDASGNVYILGVFYDTADMDPGVGTFTFVPGTSGFADNFIVKLDVNGNFVWAKQFGGLLGDQAFALTLDFFGNIYFTGNFNSLTDFDPGPATYNLNPVGQSDVFVVKIDNNGNLIWAKSFGGTSLESSMSIDVSYYGYSVVAVGHFYSANMDFDPSALSYTLSPMGNGDAFVERLSGLSTLVSEQNNLGMEYFVFPNPTQGKIYFTPNSLDKLKSLCVTNSLGQIVYNLDLENINNGNSLEIDLSFLPKGFYLINQNGIISGNSIKLIIN